MPLVWAIDPETRLVLAMRPREEPVELRLGDVLTGSPVLPRFRVRVDALFRGLRA